MIQRNRWLPLRCADRSSLRVCSMARRSFASARLSEMSVEGQAVNVVLVFKVKSVAKNLITFVVDPVSSDADECEDART